MFYLPFFLRCSFFLTFFCSVFLFSAIAQTPLGGTFNADTTLALVDSPFEMATNVTVSSGITMTIEPGVEIGFPNSHLFIINGTLIANGTPSDSIQFKGINGSPTTHGGRLDFAASSLGNQISYTVLKKMGEVGASNPGITLSISTTDLLFEKSRIVDSERYGIQINGAISPIIRQNKIEQCNTYGFYHPTPGGDPFLENNIFSNNGSNGTNHIHTHASNVSNFLNNEAEYIQILDPILDTATLPKLALVGGAKYQPLSDLDIEPNANLIIEPGVEIQLNSSQNIMVRGTLIANGTPSDSIRFVGINSSASNHGGRMAVFAGSSNNQISYAVLEKMGEISSNLGIALSIGTSDLLFEKSRIIDSERYGIQINGAISPIIRHNKIQDCSIYGFYHPNAGGDPFLEDNVFSNNGSLGTGHIHTHASNVSNFLNNEAEYIQILDPILDTATLPKLALIGGAKYQPIGDLDIEPNARLIIEPGVEVQFTSSQNIMIRGTLIADGTPSDSIRFVGINPSASSHGGRIAVFAESSGTQISHAVLEKMGEISSNLGIALSIGTSDLLFEKSRIVDSERYGIQINGAISPIIRHNKIQDCSIYGFYHPNAGGMPFLEDNIFSNNGFNGTNHIKVDICSVGNFSNNEAEYIEIDGDVTGNFFIPNTALVGGTKYRRSSSLIIQNTATLTIASGVTMQLNSDYDITVNGTLIANGTASDSIRFVGVSSNSATHGGAIRITNQSAGTKISCAVLDHMGEGGPNHHYTALLIETSDFVFEKSRIVDSERDGIKIVSGVAPIIRQNIIEECGHTDLNNTAPNSKAHIEDNIFTGINSNNTILRAHVGNLENYSNNTLPFIEIEDPLTTTATLPKAAMVGGAKYRLIGDLNIETGAKLIIKPGVEMQFYGSEDINVFGTLIAKGTPSDSIKFLGVNPSSSSRGGGILLTNQSFGNEISYALFDRMGDNGVNELEAVIKIKTSSAIVQKSRLQDGVKYGIWIDGSVSPTIQDNIFDDVGLFSALYHPNAGGKPKIINNTFLNNSNDTRVNIATIGAYSNNHLDFIDLTGKLDRAATLPKASMFGGAKYRLPQTAVDTSGILTIEPGVILEFIPGRNLFIDGTLIAVSTDADTIKFIGVNGSGSQTEGGMVMFTEKSKNNRLKGVEFTAMGNNSTHQSTLNIRTSSIEIDNVTLYENDRRGITVASNASPHIKNLTINDNFLVAVEVLSGNPIFENCSFLRSNTGAISVKGGSPVFKNCAIADGITDDGIANVGNGIVDARNCWWGTDTGPLHSILNPDGEGDVVSDRVWFNPWLMASIKELQCDSTTLDTLSIGIPAYYVFKVPDSLAGTSFLLHLQTDATQGVNEIYGEADILPKRGNTTYFLDTEPVLNPSLFMPGLAAGTYYFLVQPTGTGLEHVNLMLEKLDFQIQNVLPSQGGNTSFVTTIVKGAEFEPNSVVHLEQNGQVIITAQSIDYQNAGLLFATFDLRQMPLGMYDLVVTKMNGDTAHWSQPFEIIKGEIIPGLTDNPNATGCSPPDVDVGSVLMVNVDSPGFGRPNRTVPISISYENTSTIDIPIPRRMFVSLRGTPMSFDIQTVEEGASQLLLIMRENGGPENVLRGGAKGTIQVFAKVIGGQNGFELLD